MDTISPCTVTVIQDGMVVIENYFTLNQQQKIVDTMMKYGNGTVHPHFNFYGGQVVLMDHGFHGISPTVISESNLNMRTKGSIDIPVEYFPQSLIESCFSCVNLAIQHSPSIPIMNNPYKCKLLYYSAEKHARLGWHQDTVQGIPLEAHKDVVIPVVSFSFGDVGVFKYKNSFEESPKTLLLKSGSALVFGGPSRMIWHSINKIQKGTTPVGLHMPVPGRFSLTFREEGHPCLWESNGVDPVLPYLDLTNHEKKFVERNNNFIKVV